MAETEVARDMHHEVSQLANQLKLLADPTRLQLICYLKSRALCVCDLVELTKMTQPNISQHMRKLRDGGLVSETRKGQWIYYALSVSPAHDLYSLINQLPDFGVEIEQLKKDCC